MARWREYLGPVEAHVDRAGAPAAAAAAPRDHVAVVPAELAAGCRGWPVSAVSLIATIIQTAWAVFLSRMTGQVTVVFGETVSGRPADLEGADQMVGLFINTVPVVVTVDDDVTLGELLDTVQHDKTTPLDHHHIGLVEITATTAHRVLFDTLTVCESYPLMPRR